MKHIFVLLCALLVGAFSAAADPAVEGVSAKIQTGMKAPDFELQDHTGKSVKLSDFPGRVVVLHWTNAQCPFIQRHYKAKTWSTITDRFATKNVVVLGVDSSNFITKTALASTVAQNSLPYRILNDSEGTVGKLYGAKTTPHVFVIDTEGKIAYQGAVDDDALGELPDRTHYVVNAIEAVIAGKQVPVSTTKPYGCSVKY